MALEEKSVVDSINVLELGQIEVRRATIIMKDGEEITRTYHRHVVAPGDDLTNEDAKVKSIAEVVHTAEVIAAYEASIS